MFYSCSLLFTRVLFVFTLVHSCSTRVHSCSLVFIGVLLVFIGALLVFIGALLVFIRVHWCSFVFPFCGVLDQIFPIADLTAIIKNSFGFFFCALIAFLYFEHLIQKAFGQPNLKFLIGILFSEFSISV